MRSGKDMIGGGRNGWRSPLSLDGKVAVVTGGAQGIGRAVVLQLAHLGSRVAIFDLPGEEARETMAQASAFGGDVCYYPVSVANRDDTGRAVAAVSEAFGPVDILVNNAGVASQFPFLEIPLDEWRRILEINVVGVYNCCQAMIPAMVERGGGRIVMVSSAAAFQGGGGGAHYATSKGALISMTRALAREFAPKGVIVNAVAPSSIETDMLSKRFKGADRDNLIARVPLKRLGTPEDVANVIAFLSSDMAAFVTGQVILVDGGRVYSA